MGVKKQPYVMSQSELQSMREEAQMNRQIAKQIETEQYGAGTRGAAVDKANLIKQAQHFEKIVDKHTPVEPKGIDKDKMAKRAEELREKMKLGMPSINEMNDLRRHPGAPQKNLSWEMRNAKNAYEYKQIMRRLDPHDPGAGSVERFRK